MSVKEEEEFQVDDEVLCRYRGVYFKAKVKELVPDPRRKELRYKVHYNGWNARHDEVVGLDRLVRYSKKNEEKYCFYPSSEEEAEEEELEDEADSDYVQKGNKRRKRFNRKGRQKKRRSSASNASTDKEDIEDITVKVTLSYPPAFVVFLKNDKEMFKTKKKVIPLPKDPFTVDRILQDFYTTQEKFFQTHEEQEIYDEFVNGLKNFFEKAIERQLLYDFERPQYYTLIEERHLEPCEVYGVEHLLRLIAILPKILNRSVKNKFRKILLTKKLNDFLEFLLLNEKKYFTSKYIDMPREYVEKV